MRQNDSLHVAINANVNLLDRKSLHTHDRRRLAHTVLRKNYTDPLIALVFVIDIRIMHKFNFSVNRAICTKYPQKSLPPAGLERATFE